MRMGLNSMNWAARGTAADGAAGQLAAMDMAARFENVPPVLQSGTIPESSYLSGLHTLFNVRRHIIYVRKTCALAFFSRKTNASAHFSKMCVHAKIMTLGPIESDQF